MSKELTYVFGNPNKPVWFEEECVKGKIKINIDDEGTKTAKISSGVSVFVANVGDLIVKSFNGLSVRKKVEKAKVNKEEE